MFGPQLQAIVGSARVRQTVPLLNGPALSPDALLGIRSRNSAPYPEAEQVAGYLSDARKTATPAPYGVYVTAATCGLRISELTGLKENDVDLGARLLHVRQTLVRASRDPVRGRPKTESGCRTILLPDAVVDAVRDALRWRKEQRLRLGPKLTYLFDKQTKELLDFLFLIDGKPWG